MLGDPSDSTAYSASSHLPSPNPHATAFITTTSPVEGAQPVILARGKLKIKIITLNVDGRWDESIRHRLWQLMDGQDTSGGILLLQDTRFSQIECQRRWQQWWAGRPHSPEGPLSPNDARSVVSALRFNCADPLQEPGEDLQKTMGGLLSATWGCLASRSRPDLNVVDKWGRWTLTVVNGRRGRAIAVFNVYRWPATTQGGLAARECRLRGWEPSPSGLRRVERAFFEELGSAIRSETVAGREIIVGGDLNVHSCQTISFTAWLGDLGLSDTDPFNRPTFFSSGSHRSRLDYILVSAGLTLPNASPAFPTALGHVEAWGHRAVLLDLAEAVSGVLGLSLSDRLAHRLQAQARANRNRQRPPPVIDSERCATYKTRHFKVGLGTESRFFFFA